VKRVTWITTNHLSTNLLYNYFSFIASAGVDFHFSFILFNSSYFTKTP